MACLSGKYWYSEPMLTPATSAMRLVVTAPAPCFLSTRGTASRTASTVWRERSCCGWRRLGGISSFFMCGPVRAAVASAWRLRGVRLLLAEVRDRDRSRRRDCRGDDGRRRVPRQEHPEHRRQTRAERAREACQHDSHV